MSLNNELTPKDRIILRDLAKEVADIAAAPEQEKRRQDWAQHNDLKLTKPLIYISPEGSWGELVPGNTFTCESRRGRQIEGGLRRKIYGYRHFQHDLPVEADFHVGKVIRNTGWGLEVKRTPSTEARGAWHYDPVMKSAEDAKKLRKPEIEYDEAASLANEQYYQDLFGDILNVKLCGVRGIGYHLMQQYANWRGLEELMMDMYCEPQLLHDVVRFLTEGHKGVLKQYEEQGLLELNNDETYNGSGGNGYSNEFPDPKPNGVVRPSQMWAMCEAQELAQVGPDQHYEFCLVYEKELMAAFGRTAYGCCEDLTDKLDYAFELPNLRRISISPWADVDKCAEKLKGNYIFSWKPHPAHLVGNFDEKMLHEYIGHTIDVCMANGCVLEMILKDTHTCEHHPERFDRWTKIAREEINRRGL